jgi:hypothetical protein
MSSEHNKMMVMRAPTAILEGRKLPRVIFSIRLPAPSDPEKISLLMKKAYETGAWCFDLPTTKHYELFRGLKRLIDDRTLIGVSHIDAEEGLSFSGKPLHQFESKILSTIKKNLLIPNSIRNFPLLPFTSDIFTQKEIDRITFDPSRFEKVLSLFAPEVAPFLLIGGRYGDWLLALGRIDLLKEMIRRVRGKGFIPIFSGQWATFALPKAKPLEAAAYAIPVNKKWSFFDLSQACDLIKKFDRPVISLNPLADGELLKESEEALSFLFDELKIYLAIPEIKSEEEVKIIFEALKKIPSLIPHTKA